MSIIIKNFAVGWGETMISYELVGILLTVILQGLYVAFKMGKFEQKLSDIEEKQDKHNNLIERTYKNECDISVLKEKISVENHRIEDLEDMQNECIRKRS